MLLFDKSETLGLTSTELIFSSRSVRNVTITRPSASGIPSTPLYVIETPKNLWVHPPNTIYKIDRSGQKEHVATLDRKVFTKDLIVLRGERKPVKELLPEKVLYR